MISKPGHEEDWIRGAIDLHVHSGEDHVDRLMTDEQVVGEAWRRGMKGLVLKSHARCTLAGCREAERKLGIRGTAFGSWVLNSWEQMEDVAGIEQALLDGLKLVYMPTTMSANPLNPVVIKGGGMALLDGQRLKPQVAQAIKLVVHHGGTLATGHADAQECLAILEYCHDLGAPTVLVTHPEYWVTDMSDRKQQELAERYPSILFERTLYSIVNVKRAREHPGSLTIVAEQLDRMINNIQRIGGSRTILCSDLGQTFHPTPIEGFTRFLSMIAAIGISRQDIQRMVKANPFRALGLYQDMIDCEIEIAFEDCRESFITSFRSPLVGYADAGNPDFERLKHSVGPQHILPGDVLTNAQSVISIFLPFDRSIVTSNLEGTSPSPQWCRAYTDGNGCLDKLVSAAAKAIRRCGFQAEIHRGSHHLTNLHEPDIDPSLLTSAWSQRHVAQICGLGSFGMNNLLITPKGCAGRFASLVTNMPLQPRGKDVEQRCLGKSGKGCMECIKRCPAGALSPEGFDRTACWNHLVANNDVSRNAGLAVVNVCGKCATGVPCSFLDANDMLSQVSQ